MKNKLLDYCKISGQSIKRFTGERKYIATGDVIANKIVSGEMVNFSNKPSRANQDVEINELLFAKMIGTNKVLQIDETNKDYIYSTGFYVIKPFQKIYFRYLFWFLNSNNFNNQKNNNCTGSTMRCINNNGLSNVEINKIPSLDIQISRSNKLDNINKAIDNRKKILLNYEDLMNSLFDELILNNDCSNEKLSFLCTKITDGKHGDCKNQNDSGYYFISAKDIDENGINLEKARQIIQHDFFGANMRTNLQENDVLVVNTGATIGKTVKVSKKYANENLTFQKSVAIISTNPMLLNPDFLIAYIKNNREKIYNEASGSAQKNWLLSQMRNHLIIIPSITEQNHFSESIKFIQKQKTLIEQDIKDLESLLEAKMYEYFD